MAIRNARPLIWKPKGLSDTEDATDSFPGAMQQLINLIPSPTTKDAWVPRPASGQVTAFSGIAAPTVGTGLLVVGNIAYGFMGCSSGTYSGYDVPWAYNLNTGTFLSISGITASNLPVSQSTTGNWTPPIIALVGSRVIFCHPGFLGSSNGFFGWLDISSYSSATLTGNTDGSTAVITSLSTDPIAAGVGIGMTISGTGIPANSTVIAMTRPSFDLQTDGNFNAGSLIITNVQDVTGVLAGMQVSGPAILAGTTVSSVSTFSLSTTGTTNGTTTISGVASTTGVLPGMSITDGSGDIPAGTLVASVTVSTIVLTKAATGSHSGDSLTIDGGNTVTLSAAATATSTSLAVDFTGGATITISANTTSANVGDTLTIDGGTPVAPQWASGNTNGFALPGIPATVAEFNGRAYYGGSFGLVFSDTLNATQVSNLSSVQAITFANGLAVTALAQLPLNSTSLGGMVQALVVFQGDSNMAQITGDAATNNLARNNISVGTGCLAPNTIVQTDAGLAFMGTDGLRILNFFAVLSPPIGANGDGVSVPFINAVWPARMCAAYNQNVYRVSVQNGAKADQPYEEYWYDFRLKVWSGPHSFPMRLIAPWQGRTVGNADHGFVGFPYDQPNQLWESPVVSIFGTDYVENGTTLQCTYETALLPDNQMMAENAVVESSLMFKTPFAVTVTATDENDNLLGTVTLPGVGGNLAQQALPWPAPVVFKQMAVTATFEAAQNVEIGNLYMRYQILGYQIGPIVPPVVVPEYLLLETGFKIVLEDSSGDLLLESSP